MTVESAFPRSAASGEGEPLGGYEVPAEFLAKYPEYADTVRLDRLRATEYAYLDDERHVYLDFTGAGLAASQQYARHVDRLSRHCFGNPHSENPTSRAATDLIEEARRQVVEFFSASPDEYVAIFTPNATGACRIVAEAYPFGPERSFVLTFDNHNSVNGMREFARARGAATRYVPVSPPELRVDEEEIVRNLTGEGLFAFPAQSNFSGVQHSLDWIEVAQSRGYDVFLDAAAFVPTNRLDLSRVKPEFVAVSWYKVFGYPTGVGCLLARRDALRKLRRPWFAGGTIQAVSVQGDWHSLCDTESAFEDGTLNFLAIPDVAVGLSWIENVGVDAIHTRVKALTGWFIEKLTALRHANGNPLVRLYGPASSDRRGATISFNFLDPDGTVVDERLVGAESSQQRFSIRTGCFCNPGAGEGAFEIHPEMLRADAFTGVHTMDEYIRLIGLPSGGAIRVSFGIASTISDAERFLAFAAATYTDRHTSADGLTPRVRC